jgi:hypothetical protein
MLNTPQYGRAVDANLSGIAHIEGENRALFLEALGEWGLGDRRSHAASIPLLE